MDGDEIMQCPYCRVARIYENAAAKYCATCGLIKWKKEGDEQLNRKQWTEQGEKGNGNAPAANDKAQKRRA
jgi:hypothetical protein